MYNKLALCRAVMRLYSFCDLNPQINIIQYNNAKDLLSEYFKVEPSLKKAFQQVGIQMHLSGVKSSFNKVIKTVLEVCFIYEKNPHIVPDNILKCLQNFLLIKGIKIQSYSKPTLFWGYTGRFFDIKNGKKFITDGLQYEDKIIIDFLTYSNASHDCLYYRLIHELLHVLGIKEENMYQFILPACKVTYELAKPFVCSLLNENNYICNKFQQSLLGLTNEKKELTNHILQLGNNLCKYGFPKQMDIPLYATTYLSGFPNIIPKKYCVLFM